MSNNTCETCCGHSISGKPCICGGTGRHSDEVANLRLKAMRCDEAESLIKRISECESKFKGDVVNLCQQYCEEHRL